MNFRYDLAIIFLNVFYKKLTNNKLRVSIIFTIDGKQEIFFRYLEKIINFLFLIGNFE